nr:reverse transcriptase domain-containing protein [Tanacetum cinerariifolium]
KQTPGTTNSVFTMMGPLLGTTQATTTITSATDLQRAPFTTPHQMVPETDLTEPPPTPLRKKGSDLEVDDLALEGVAPKLAPSDPDDHLKIFESAATIENWPQPVWCHMLVRNAQNWFRKLPRRSIDGFKELRRAFRLNFTQRKKCAKNPVELARVKQRQGESTSAYVERYKDECIHVKACPEILKISGFMNGINNPELIKRLSNRVPQTLDELMQRTRSFIQGEAVATDSKKSYSNYKSQEQPRRQSNDQSSNHNNSYRNQRGDRGNDKYTPLTKTPKEILTTEGANFLKPPPMRTLEERRVGNRYCEYHGQKGHTTNECVQLRQLIDKLVKEGRLDHLVKNIKEGKDKQKSGVVEPPTIEINAGGHDIHRMYIDGGASVDILYKIVSKDCDLKLPSPYNGIIGRPGISAIRAVPSTAHGMLKFPVDGGIVTIYNTIVTIHPDYPEQEVSIGGSLSDRGRVAMCALLQRNLDIFAWEPKHRTGDFVYRANGTSHAEDAGKLRPKWEGPYEVTEALGNGAYKLRDMDGRELPRTWNICNLKRCYL